MLPGGDYVAVSVDDTGTGMDETTLARAVDPFFTTKPVGKGTGLGLASVHNLATQAQGALRLMSVIGRGTTVQLWLPRGPCP
jgi:signal transduction histidine kinase